jgi:hypothetical protein
MGDMRHRRRIVAHVLGSNTPKCHQVNSAVSAAAAVVRGDDLIFPGACDGWIMDDL